MLHSERHSQADWIAPTAETAVRIIGPRKFFVDLKFLWLEQMLEVRANMIWIVAFSLVYPLAIVFGIGHIGTGLNDRVSLLYIISGSAILSVSNDALASIALRLASMRKEGMLIYYASLPISKVAFVSAMLLSRLVLSLPAMLSSILLGPLIYGVHFEFNLWVVLLLILVAFSMSTIGLAVGLLIQSLEVVQIMTGIILTIVTLAAPIFIPADVLPLPLRLIGYCFPPTYAADALRLSLSGDMGTQFYTDVLVLTALTIVSLYVMNRWLNWRVK